MEQLQIIGNIGTDCQLVNNNGSEFYSLSVACSERIKKLNGETEERTTWYKCILNKDRFKNVAQYLLKGVKVLVIGKPKYNIYKLQDGIHRVGINLLANELVLLSSATKSTPTAEHQNKAIDTDPFSDCDF